MPSRLIIPDEGELSYQPVLIPPEIALEASSDIMSNPNIGGVRHFLTQTNGRDPFVLPHAAPLGFQEELPTEMIEEANEARMQIYERLFDTIDFDWRQVIGYARVMSRISGNSQLGLHTDGTRDVRVLANAGGSVTWFFSGRYRSKYPNGLPLFPGDVVTVNNLCPPDDQVEHGVKLSPDSAIRVGFLFHVYERLPQKVSTQD